MSTLMSTGNSSGETGRCDAKCYNATTPHCTCCCGGRNHGVGLQKARENIQDYVDDMMKEWEKDHPGEHFIVTNTLF